MPSNHYVKGPSNISMFALAIELQRSWHFQRTFSKHQIGSPRDWDCKAKGRTCRIWSQCKWHDHPQPDHSQNAAEAVLKVLPSSWPCKDWKGRWSLFFPVESQSTKVKAPAQGIRTAGQTATGFALGIPAVLPCTPLCFLSSPSKAGQCRGLLFSCRCSGRALPSRAETTFLSGHKSFWRPAF